MLSDIRKTLQQLTPELVALRHELHQFPEIRFEEHRTSERIAAYLREAGIPYTRGHAKGTGIVATIQGRAPGRTLALRADMDALEIEEQTGLLYASRIPGCMHACGHDGHSTILCGVAKTLWQQRENFAGQVKLIFQPAEEQAAGGRHIVEEGLLDDVDAAFALHCWPSYTVGTAGVGEGCVMASADYFCIDVIGKGGHGADPAAAIDPVVIASHIVVALQSIVSRETNPWDAAVVSAARIVSGHASNVIPETAQIEGTYRALTPAHRERLPEAIERIATHVAAAFRARVQLTWDDAGYPMLHNDPAMARLAQAAVVDALGADHLMPVAHPYMTAEDFAYYLQKVPGAFVFLGNRPAGATTAPGLHTAAFDFNDDAIPHGVQTFCAIAQRFLTDTA